MLRRKVIALLATALLAPIWITSGPASATSDCGVELVATDGPHLTQGSDGVWHLLVTTGMINWSDGVRSDAQLCAKDLTFTLSWAPLNHANEPGTFVSTSDAKRLGQDLRWDIIVDPFVATADCNFDGVSDTTYQIAVRGLVQRADSSVLDTAPGGPQSSPESSDAFDPVATGGCGTGGSGFW